MIPVKPPIPGKEMAKVIACLKLTTSNQDGEVVNGLRGANRILKHHGLDWDKLVDAVFAQAVYRCEQTAIAAQNVTIPEALKTLLAVMPTSKFKVLIESFHKQWEDRGSLSDRQREVLRQAWQKHNPYVHTKKTVGF